MDRDGSLLATGFSQALSSSNKPRSRQVEQDDEALADISVVRRHLDAQSMQVMSSVLLRLETDRASFDGGGVLAANAMHGDGLWSQPAEHASGQGATANAAARLVETASSHGSSSPSMASVAPQTMIVTADKSDYAPGSTATFTVDGIAPGGSVAFQIADLAGSPGANGIADVYAPFRVTDGGAGDMDGRANGIVVANWQVPADGSATGAELRLAATSNGQTASATFSDAANKIVTENQKAGTPESVWSIHGSIDNEGDTQIEGFTTQISTNAGQTVSFKINTASSGYTLDIYRLGYYGGSGARLVTSMHHSGADNQPDPIFNTATRTVDAGNWSVTDSWAIPSTTVSGVYFAKLTTDSGNFQNMIPFIVRNDGSASDLLFQTSDETWEAYNPWGGYNLYQGVNGRDDRAYAVSYNRPLAMNSMHNVAGPQDFLFGEEYAAIYWLEQNGYDVSYISGIDAATNAGLLRNAKAYIDVGHDEYWSQSQFANVKAAAAAGVNEAFLSGNQIYWDVALAPSLDSSATPNRTVVEYKDIWSGTQLNPNGTAGGGTGLFRDPLYGPGTPENSLSGTIFTVDESGALNNITIPASMSQLRFWRNTSIASSNGGTLTGLLGYEWDSDLDNGSRPGGLIDMSSTTMDVGTLLLDNGFTTGAGTATHSLTLYRDPTSGALVFGAGTVMWSWGLSNQHAEYRGMTEPVSPAVQQSMVNLFADMGVSPQTLQASLVLAQASTDHTAPTAVITSPTGGTSVSEGQPITITGTASDVGGRVAGVEVSFDGGKTWHPAVGTTSWSYAWNASGAGTHVLEARASDDSVNLSSPATVSINVSSPGPSLFSESTTPAQTGLNDRSPIEAGVKFTSSTAGQITALKFYRSPSDTGSDLLDLWSASGTKLASAAFTNTALSGWQTVALATPVSIAANTTYIASYHTNGAYVATNDYFANSFTSGSLTAPSSASSGGNGVYSYGGTSSAGIFPTNNFGASNYWADVVFSSGGSTTDTPPVLAIQTSDQNAVVGSTFSLTLPTGTFTDSDGDVLTYAATAANGSALPSWLTFNPSTRTFGGTPASANVGTFGVKVSATDPGGFSASEMFNIAVTTTAAALSLFTASSSPAQTGLNDGSPIELGMKFTSSAAGQITALKFYRSPGDTGSDLLDLWTSTGTKLASATFSSTTATGWQTVTLATPVSIAANTTYVASYHTDGTYVATGNFFTSAVTSGTLTAPSSTSSGGNGVYSYGGTSTAGIFPTQTFSASNYWADVVFATSTSTGNNNPPTAVADAADATEKGGVNNNTGGSPASGNVLTNDTDPDAGDTKTVTAVSFGSTAGTLGSALNGGHGSLVLNASGAFTYTVNETDSAVQALRLSTNTLTDVFSYTMRDTAGATSSTTLNVTIHGANDAPVLATQTAGQNAVIGSAFSLTLPTGTFTDVDASDTLTYAATAANGSALPAWLAFNASTRTFSGTPTSADAGTVSIKTTATDLGGLSASETFNIAVTTTAATASLFTASNTPTQTSLNDGRPLEVGVKFTSSTAGQITALKFYRSPSDTGTDLVDLWTSTGTKLASATFSSTTASGWQTVTLATPVSIAANTTYVASYHTSGPYVATNNFFTSALTSGPLTAPSSGNGVYAYGGTNSAGLFPTNTFSSANYYADVVFRPQLA